MKRFIMAIVCLMAIVLSANAHNDLDKAYQIDDYMSYNLSTEVLYIQQGISAKYKYCYGWGYALRKDQINSFVSFLKEVNAIFMHYEKIAQDNNVTNFTKKINSSYSKIKIYERMNYMKQGNIFSFHSYTPTLFDSKLELHFEVNPIGECSLTFKSIFYPYNKTDHHYVYFSNHKEIDELIKKLNNIDEKIFELKVELIERKRKEQERRDTELKEKKRIDNLFELKRLEEGERKTSEILAFVMPNRTSREIDERIREAYKDNRSPSEKYENFKNILKKEKLNSKKKQNNIDDMYITR